MYLREGVKLMKNAKGIFILILLASLALGLATCGNEPEPTAVPQAEAATATPVAATDTPAPTDTPEPTDTAVPESEAADELDLGELGTPDDLASYRANMSISISGTEAGEAVDGALSFLIEHTSEPLAQHFVISAEGFEDAGGMEGIEMYQVDDMAYLQMGEQWLSVPATENMLAEAGYLRPEDILEDTCGWNKESDTEYDGIAVHHWTTSKEDLEACLAAEDLAGFGELTAASGELYIAVEGRYVVHMNLVYEGKDIEGALGNEDQVLEEGRVEFTFGLSNVNEPFVIELPEEARASSSLPEDIPFPEDAQEIANAFGFISFSSPSTMDVVADFYKAEMPQNGWTESSVSEVSGMFMLEYSKEGRTASLMISSDDETELTSVMLTIQE
jgi:hypothetical protein